MLDIAAAKPMDYLAYKFDIVLKIPRLRRISISPWCDLEITAEALRLHRGMALERHRTSLTELARRLSFNTRNLPLPQELLDWFEERRPFPPHIAYLEKRYQTELFRLALSLLAADLADAAQMRPRAGSTE